MARVLLASQAWGWVTDTTGQAQPSTSVTITNLDGSAATHWSALTGGTSSTGALMTNSDGTLPRYIDVGTYDMTVGATTRRVEAVAGGNPADLAALKQIKTLLTREATDSRGDTLPLGLRRAYQWRRPVSSTRYTGTAVPSGSEVWTGLELIPEDDTGPERLNATAGGLALAFLARYAALKAPGEIEDLMAVRRFADALLPLQWSDPTTLRYGGYMASPNLNTASSFGTGVLGLGMLEAWRATGDSRYLESAVRAADFCLRLSDPNTYWFPTYAVNPINRTSGGTTWYGFCDEVTATDKITTSCSLWNLKAAELCEQVYQITGTTALHTAATQARDFMVNGLTAGPYDFFAVSTNVDATYVVITDYNDHSWHRAGDIVATSTVGTDGPEYAIPALINLGYTPATIHAAYEAIRARPHNDPGTSFGAAFDSAICWTGYLRTGVFYGTYYDAQGAGTLGGYKALYYPDDFQASRPILDHVATRGGIQDENLDAIWSTMTTYKFATQGTIVVAGAGLALINAIEGRA